MKLSPEIKEETTERINLRNKRTLLLKFSEDAKIENKEDLKKIVPKALSVRFPNYSAKKKILRTAFVEFETIEETENSFVNLKEIKLPAGSLEVSRFTDEKSVMDDGFDPLSLYVNGIPEEAETSEIEKIFPDASISRNTTKNYRFAILTFKTEENASKAFWSGKDIKIRGSTLLVLYSKNNTQSKWIPNAINDKRKKVKRLQNAKKNLSNLDKDKK